MEARAPHLCEQPSPPNWQPPLFTFRPDRLPSLPAIADPLLHEQALRHISAIPEMDHQDPLIREGADLRSNRRLEWEGDSALSWLVSRELARQFPTATSGDLSVRSGTRNGSRGAADPLLHSLSAKGSSRIARFRISLGRMASAACSSTRRIWDPTDPPLYTRRSWRTPSRRILELRRPFALLKERCAISRLSFNACWIPPASRDWSKQRRAFGHIDYSLTTPFHSVRSQLDSPPYAQNEAC